MDNLDNLQGYSAKIKISGWQNRNQSHPFDNDCAVPTGASHYLSFGATNERFIPKTTAREHQESGMTSKAISRIIAKKAINFVSYAENDFRFQKYVDSLKDPLKDPTNTSSYRDDYKPPKPMIKHIDCCIPSPDPLLNRIPKCDFEILPTSEHKFMDDHILKISEGRKKINYLRQIRNATNPFGIATKK